MTRSGATRAWAGRCRYPGKQPFVFGTARVRLDATHQEVQEALKALWDGMVPFPPPEYVEAVPGMVLFVPEGES